MRKVRVFVTLKENVLDPQGHAVKHALHTLQYSGVQEVRIGKYLELTLDDSVENVEEAVKEMCVKILSNPVIEDFQYEIEEGVTL